MWWDKIQRKKWDYLIMESSIIQYRIAWGTKYLVETFLNHVTKLPPDTKKVSVRNNEKWNTNTNQLAVGSFSEELLSACWFCWRLYGSLIEVRLAVQHLWLERTWMAKRLHRHHQRLTKTRKMRKKILNYLAAAAAVATATATVTATVTAVDGDEPTVDRRWAPDVETFSYRSVWHRIVAARCLLRDVLRRHKYNHLRSRCRCCRP